MNLEKRKKELIEIAISKYTNGGTIFKLINEGYLDHIISKINDEITLTNSKAIIKKGYLTGNEQFINVLSEMISYFSDIFCTIKHKEIALEFILEQTIPNFLLCKKYWGDNSFISYYTKNMNILFVKNFYDNIKFIYYEYFDFFQSINIEDNLKLNKTKDVNIILDFMIKLIWCNCERNQYSISYIFSNYKLYIIKLKNKYKNKIIHKYRLVYDDYVMHWNLLISEYEKNIEYIKKIL